MSPEEKKLEKLNKLFELVNEEYATPDDLIQLSEAILSILKTERENEDKKMAEHHSQMTAEMQTSRAEMDGRMASLQNLIASLKSDSIQALSQATQSLQDDIKRVEKKIPSKTDLSGLEREIRDIKDSFNSFPTELTVNGEAVRDGLELLQGDERLDKSAIKGLDDWEEIAQLARSPKTINGAGTRLLRYLADVNIEGITNGQTIIWNSTLSRFVAGTAGASSPLTTKGDLYTRTTVDARLAVGTDGQVLSADSTQATGLKWIALAGGGDMLLAAVQTVSALKTYLAGTLGLRNVANTFTSFFTNTNTASRTYTLKDATGTLAFTTDITGTNSGTNTGDQTTIAGITGTLAQFNTAITDADITPAARLINTTAPLSGGGDMSADRTLTTSMATNKLIGRGTAGTGVFEEITLGTNLSFTGTTLNATGGGGVSWGAITGTLSSQTDLQSALNLKASKAFAVAMAAAL